MKRNKTEKRVFEAANSLTPEPSSFENATREVDWSNVAQSCHPKQSKHRFFVPVIVAASAICLAAAVAIPTSIFFSNRTHRYGAGDSDIILYGVFEADRWLVSDSSMDFSRSALEVIAEKREVPQCAALFGEDGNYVCSVYFLGEPFSLFDFENLAFEMNEFRGMGSYLGENYTISICFPFADSDKKEMIVSFGNSNNSQFGSVYYAPIA